MWTEDQTDAIEAKGGSFLVSAAAGSGKTAVLVQRTIGLLADDKEPVPANKLLIVTFTRAAAAEMRMRLEKALGVLIRENPGNDALRRQSILLSQASIGTMHGFCAETIRNYFHELDISPGFKIITDKQEEELKRRAVEEAIENMLSQEAGERLGDAFSADRDDGGLANAVLELYGYMSSHPFPSRWLSDMAKQYRIEAGVGESPWGRIILHYTVNAAEHCIGLMNTARETVMIDSKLEKAFIPLIENECSEAEAVLKAAKSGDWQVTYEAVKSCSFARMPSVRGYADNPLKIYVQALRTEWKETVEKKLKFLFPTGEEGCREEFALVGDIVDALSQITEDFARRYREKKEEKDFFDYNDLEHKMIELLVDSQGNRTKAAIEISGDYDRIMIDEFQDINAVQELIFKSVSRDESNLFMVGDVKQSIYGFRQAMPEIFIKTRDSYDKYSRKEKNSPAYIVLGKNFRSRKNVTQSVNFVFSQIMHKETGDIEYNREEELVYGASYPEKEGCQTEIHIVKQEDDESVTQAEGRRIAAAIWEMINTGFTVSGRDGERPVEFKDFCILLRSANAHAHDYAAALQKQGIPARATIMGGFFAAREIGVMLSFLRIISNPNQDIPLLTVLLSPIYGFSHDYMLRLRMENPDKTLYAALLQAEDELCKRVIEDIAYYRAACVTLSSNSFIELLYGKTGYLDMVLAMDEGESRLANLQLLQKYARDYEQSGYNGISGFTKFMDRLQENRSDLQAAEAGTNIENSVSIMSVHKSKGLEFPVCIVAGCNRKKRVNTDQVLLHPELGLGIMLPGSEIGVKYRTVSREAVALDNNRRESAEEMRILYVAMTRAKEKLIMISTLKKPEDELAKLASKITHDGISNFAAANSKSFAEWILMCALRHPDGKILREMAGADASIIDDSFKTPWKFVLKDAVSEIHVEIKAETLAEPDMGLYKKIEAAAEYTYTHEGETSIPTKVTASSIAAKEHKTQWTQPLSRPAWLSAKGLTPAERGTALHDYMQYSDFQKAAADPDGELSRLVSDGFLTAEQGGAVNISHIKRFFQSDVGKRILKSKEVEKERRFIVEIPANDVMESNNSTDCMVVLQGAVDCTFIEDGKLHIIDFKTDRIQCVSELLELYTAQILLYAKAMKEVTGLEVGDCILYSMHLDEYVLTK